MAWNVHFQAKPFVEPMCTDNDDSSPRKWTSCLSSNKTSALDRGSLKSKKGGKLSIHHNGDFSVYGAISDWCEELAQQISDRFPARGNPWRNHNERFETLPEDIRAIQASETAGFV